MSDEIINKSEVLIVDDSATVLATASKMLVGHYIVQTASNGVEAWEAIQNNLAISMIFSDMQMPEMNGMELLLKIRGCDDTRISRMPVIIVTGAMDTPAGKRAAFDVGATDFIGKPFNNLDLLSRARAHIGDSNKSKRRASDSAHGNALDMLISPSGFHSVGCQALMFAFEKKIGFTIVYIEFTNFQEIKGIVSENNAKQIIISIAMRIKGAIRDQDVATRIGENKFAVLIYTDRINVVAAVDRLSKYMNNLVFEYNNERLNTRLAFGYSNADCYNREATFSELCAQADASLQKSVSARVDVPPVVFSDSKGQSSDGSQKTVIDLWSALKYVADGEYSLIPDSCKKELVECMTAYLNHVQENSGK